jgi:S-adenosylmethionine hydrolase
LETPSAILIGPDNGLFTPFLRARTACVALTNPATHHHPVSATFHGRDIFAPVAAHLVNGFPLVELGPPVGDLIALPELRTQRLPDGRLRAEIAHVDRFGNLITNVGPFDWDKISRLGLRIIVGGVTVAVREAYADVEPGSLLGLVGSDGYLEIAVREGNAAERLGLGVGATLEVQGLEDALDDLDLDASAFHGG